MRHNFKKRHKYNATATEVDGYKFDSKAEANYYKLLKLQEQEGTITGILRQVPLHIAPGVTYRMDFLVFYSDGTAEGIEVKGYETPEWKIKKKLIEESFSWLELRIVK